MELSSKCSTIPSLLVILFMFLSFLPLSNAVFDPKLIYQSFLQCLPTQVSPPDPKIASIVHSPTTNPSEFDTVLDAYVKNSRFNTSTTRKPVMVVTPMQESHVQATILCAKKLKIQIKSRSGGHDYEGVSYVSSEELFLVLDLCNFRNVVVNIPAEMAIIPVGALLGEVYFRIFEKSKVHGYPAGVCPTVGVGGHVSGGGYGTMLRKYGLATDHVIDARIVDVNGRVLDRKSMGEDLFWAIRGGGGGSFGVILSFTVKIVSVPEVNTVFEIKRTVAENAADILYRWQEVMKTIDKDLFIRVLLQPMTINNQKTSAATFVGHFLGNVDRLVGLLNKEFPQLGLKRSDCIEVSWIKSVLFWANFDVNTTKIDILLNRKSDVVKFGKRKSDYVQAVIPKPGLTSIFNKLAELGKVGLVFNPYGGRMSEIPADAVPFPHRAGNLFKIQYSVSWTDPNPALEKDYLTQSRVLYDFMTPYVSKNPRGAFLNYRDLDLGVMTGNNYNEGKVYGEKYFKGNFERLVKIKTIVDPDNFFRNEQSIPTVPKPRRFNKR